MCVDVMHAERVPASAAWLQNRARKVLDFSIIRGGEFDNVKSPDTRAVQWNAILREANQLTFERQYSTGGTRATRVIFDDWTFTMFVPWASEFFGKIKSKRVVLIWPGTDKQPPEIGETYDRWIGALSLNQFRYE